MLHKGWQKILEQKPYLISLGLAGLLLLIGGIGLVLENGWEEKKETVEIIPVQEQEKIKSIYVDVGGAVLVPGLYELDDQARVNDALIAAGGLAEEADQAWLNKNMNLATRLKDGAKIYVPFRGEEKIESDGKINLNTAKASELDSLWGVGPATAEKIIQGRPYLLVEDLLEKNIVSDKVYDKIKDKLVL